MLRWKWFVLLPSLLLICFLNGCTKSNSNSSSNSETQAQNQTPTPQRSPLTKFESDLQYVRNGQFTYIWVFSRKDGKPLDRDDAEYLRKNAPQVVDWIGTDEGKRFIAGTNFDLEKGNMELLKKRFVVEDYTGR